MCSNSTIYAQAMAVAGGSDSEGDGGGALDDDLRSVRDEYLASVASGQTFFLPPTGSHVVRQARRGVGVAAAGASGSEGQASSGEVTSKGQHDGSSSSGPQK